MAHHLKRKAASFLGGSQRVSCRNVKVLHVQARVRPSAFIVWRAYTGYANAGGSAWLCAVSPIRCRPHTW